MSRILKFCQINSVIFPCLLFSACNSYESKGTTKIGLITDDLSYASTNVKAKNYVYNQECNCFYKSVLFRYQKDYIASSNYIYMKNGIVDSMKTSITYSGEEHSKDHQLSILHKMAEKKFFLKKASIIVDTNIFTSITIKW